MTQATRTRLTSAYKLPVFGGSSNREILGYASGIRSATVLIRRAMSVPAGATLHVWERSPELQEILDMPRGYVYAVSFGYGLV